MTHGIHNRHRIDRDWYQHDARRSFLRLDRITTLALIFILLTSAVQGYAGFVTHHFTHLIAAIG